MRSGSVLVLLSRRAPTIVIFTLVAALLGYWADAPLWLPYGIAIVAVSAALVLIAARRRVSIEEGSDSSSDKSWIAQELAGKGSPPGSYVLGFFGVVTIALTGFRGAYATPARAGFALVAAWAISNAHYPADGESEA